MGGDDDRSSQPVQFDEEAQQPPRHLGVDVTCRLVGEQELRFADHGAGDSGALFLTARENRRIGVHPLAQADPFEQFRYVLGIFGLALAMNAQAARRHSPRLSYDRAGGNPGTRCRSAGAIRRAGPGVERVTFLPNI